MPFIHCAQHRESKIRKVFEYLLPADTRVSLEEVMTVVFLKAHCASSGRLTIYLATQRHDFPKLT